MTDCTIYLQFFCLSPVSSWLPCGKSLLQPLWLGVCLWLWQLEYRWKGKCGISQHRLQEAQCGSACLLEFLSPLWEADGSHSAGVPEQKTCGAKLKLTRSIEPMPASWPTADPWTPKQEINTYFMLLGFGHVRYIQLCQHDSMQVATRPCITLCMWLNQATLHSRRNFSSTHFCIYPTILTLLFSLSATIGHGESYSKWSEIHQRGQLAVK